MLFLCYNVNSISKIKVLHEAIEELFFYKEPLTSEEPLFHKRFFVVKKVLQIIKSKKEMVL